MSSLNGSVPEDDLQDMAMEDEFEERLAASAEADVDITWGTARIPGSWNAEEFKWDAERSLWPCITEPPDIPDVELEGGAEEAREAFSDDPWLFLPNSSLSSSSTDIRQNIASSSATSHTSPPAGSTAVGSATSHTGTADPAGRDLTIAQSSMVGFLERGGSLFEFLKHPSFGAYDVLQSYTFKYLRSDAAKSLVAILLLPSWIRERNDVTVARFFKQALKEFVVEAQRHLTSHSTDENERRGALMDEAASAMADLVQSNRLQVVSDLVLALETFEIGKHRQEDTSTWMAKALCHVIGGALSTAKPEDRRSWQEQMQTRINAESNELYGQIDVRAWPKIIQLCEADNSIIDGVACVAQVRLQLCSHSDLHEWTLGLRQAATLLNSLGKADCLEVDDLCDIFNDKVHFDRRNRKDFLVSVLKDAPRWFRTDVLTYIDNVSTDLGERADEEVQLVLDLIVALDVDIRNCANANFQMQSEWLIGTYRSHGTDGIISRQELSAEQICDHIEDDANYEHLLKSAVKELLKGNRKFEAARMLARQKSRCTSTYETNRNDKQLAYLVSLYQELDTTTDRFGPIEQECLTLPCSAQDVLRIEAADSTLDRLEEETLSHQQPMTIGIWWFWRCFNLSVDKKPRASFIALSYGDTFVIVDLYLVEQVTHAAEKKVKDVLCRILAADHILKVTHDIDACSLKILQRSLIPNDTYEKHCDDIGPLPHISPVLDLSVVIAFVKQSQPAAPAVSKLMVLVLDYLRLELCMAENLSNFDRRPLRLSQKHYALTLAWCPLMILRALLSWKIVKVEDAIPMVFKLGCGDAPERWDEKLGSTWFCQERPSREAYEALDPIGMGLILDGPYGQNVWDNPEWVAEIPRPDPKFGIPAMLSDDLQQTLSLTPGSDCRRFADEALSLLADQDSTLTDLRKLYEAQEIARNLQGAIGGS